ncbi:MAG: phosphatidate cytidylyltransferase [Bacteroidales bacterium]|nr:phosphatidate cytidylyltransferase [Bacteroidales bacterium]
MSNFIQRAITGILFALVLGAALILSPVTYAMVMVCIVTLASYEFCKMVRSDEDHIHPHLMLAVLSNVVAFTLGFLLYYQGVDPRCLLILIVFVWCVFLVELFSIHQRPSLNIGLTLLCNIYIGLPFALINLLAFKDGVYDWRPIVAMFLLTWVNDTGAYLCGITMGKHKLFERVSPKKTIEGFIGGVILTLLVSYFMHGLSGLDGHKELPMWFCIASGLVMAICGTCGDLIESKFKRAVNIKDSGKLLPGHGGILDRFDAMIFAAPIVSLLYYFFI